MEEGASLGLFRASAQGTATKQPAGSARSLLPFSRELAGPWECWVWNQTVWGVSLGSAASWLALDKSFNPQKCLVCKEWKCKPLTGFWIGQNKCWAFHRGQRCVSPAAPWFSSCCSINHRSCLHYQHEALRPLDLGGGRLQSLSRHFFPVTLTNCPPEEISRSALGTGSGCGCGE